MSFPGALVIEGNRHWHIIAGDQSELLSIDVVAEELPVCSDLIMGLAKQKNANVVLAPSSASCFFCLLDSEDIVDARDRQAMLFELENHLPIDAESTVADFVTVPSTADPPPVSAVAISATRWRGIANAFEEADLPVRSIVPASILATRAICRHIELAETAELFLVDDGFVDIIELRNETVLRWKHLALNTKAIKRHRALSETEADRTLVVGLVPGAYAEFADADDADFLDGDFHDFVVEGAMLLREKPSSRWFELRRGALAPSDPLRAIGIQLRWVAVAAAACLLALAVGGWWRTTRIEKEIEDLRATQTNMFEEAFPGARVPGALLRRVRSEHSKVLSSRGENTDIQIPQSAPDLLRRVLAALPTDVRLRITRIEIIDGDVDLMIQVKNPVDAGRIATAISQAGFEVDPPGTRRVDEQTFESDLKATWVGEPSDNNGATG